MYSLLNFGRGNKILAAALAAVALLAFYSALNTRGSFRFITSGTHLNYNLLAEAVVSGHLYLNEGIPIPDDRPSVDPTEARHNFKRFLDASEYNGKYYLRHDPFPALVHVFWLLIAGNRFPGGLAVIGAAFGCLLILAAIMNMFQRSFYPEAPSWPRLYVTAMFALSGAQMFMVSRPLIYHESIAVASFWVLAATYFFIDAVLREERRPVFFCCSGICFAFALLSRSLSAVYLLSFSLLLILAWLVQKPKPTRILEDGASFAIPLALGLAAVLLYNFLRFDNPFDFGLQRVIWPENVFYKYACIDNNIFRLAHIPYNLKSYFLSAPALKIAHGIPVLVLSRHEMITPEVAMYSDQTASILFSAPFTLLSIPLSTLVRPRSKELVLLTWGIFFSSLLMLGVLLSYFFSAGRFFYDFLPFLYVTGFCNLLYIEHKLRANTQFRRLMIALLVALFCVNAVFGVYYGGNGAIQVQ